MVGFRTHDGRGCAIGQNGRRALASFVDMKTIIVQLCDSRGLTSHPIHVVVIVGIRIFGVNISILVFRDDYFVCSYCFTPNLGSNK
jgi:hypothetical protein